MGDFSAQDGSVPALHALTVLLVTEAAHDGDPLGDALQRLGLRVRTITATADPAVLTTPSDAVLLEVSTLDTASLALIELATGPDSSTAVVTIVPPDSARLAVACLQAGATRCLVKPIEARDITIAIQRAVVTRADAARTQRGNQWLMKVLEDADRDLAAERAKLLQHSVAAFETLAAALEAKDEYMAGHSLRVAHIAGAIAEETGCDTAEVEAIRLAGRLHDIGMIGVPSRITAQSTPLSAHDMRLVQQHVALASHILGPFDSLHDVRVFIEGHHERMDGTGYPKGVPAASLPRGARILAAAEIFDAVTSRRPHRGEISTPDAMALMARVAGAAIDPKVYDGLRSVVLGQKILRFLVDRPGNLAEGIGTVPMPHEPRSIPGIGR